MSSVEKRVNRSQERERRRLIARCLGFQNELSRLGIETQSVYFKGLSDRELNKYHAELGNQVLDAHAVQRTSLPVLQPGDLKLRKELKHRQKVVESNIGRLLHERKQAKRFGKPTKNLNYQIRQDRDELRGIDQQLNELARRTGRFAQD